MNSWGGPIRKLDRFTRMLEVRGQRALLLSAVTGVLTGLAVAAFEWLVKQQLFDRLVETPLAVQATLPLCGLAIAATALWAIGRGASPSTADEYIRNYHERRRLDLRPVWGRIIAGAATLGFGGALGYEGPSLYMGAAIGTGLQSRLSKYFSREDAKLLMVAGAAAGVAAIFKAPATGAVFALEVPYRDDTVKRMLLPALLAAATGYLTFVTLLGTAPLFQVAGSPPFDLKELGGAVLLGLLCGVGARGFAIVMRRAKAVASGVHPAWRVALSGIALGSLGVLSVWVFGENLALGSGYNALRWVTDPSHSLALVVALFAFRLVATAATVAGDGAGGLFIPLVVAGAITGAGVSSLVQDASTLFPLIGVAAFLGAGYRTPLAGVMFVAETTGRPGFIVPGLIASVAAQLVMGSSSVSTYQVDGRVGHLERRFKLPIAAAMRADTLTVPPDTTLTEFYQHHLLFNRQLEVPVVDGTTFVGMVSLWDLERVDHDAWDEHCVGDVVPDSWPVVAPTDTLEVAIARLEEADVDTLPVLDGARFVGVVSTAEIIRLDEILGRSEGPKDEL